MKISTASFLSLSFEGLLFVLDPLRAFKGSLIQVLILLLGS
jgi:hypothetical protein